MRRAVTIETERSTVRWAVTIETKREGTVRQAVTMATLTRMEQKTPRRKQMTKPFTLVPQASVDA